ncbi:MAG TPA: hypothetical protein VIM73_06290, partial [Polyangiaceae bacterium]
MTTLAPLRAKHSSIHTLIFAFAIVGCSLEGAQTRNDTDEETSGNLGTLCDGENETVTAPADGASGPATQDGETASTGAPAANDPSDP